MARIQKSIQFRPPTQKTKSTDHTLKTSQFRFAHSQFRAPAPKTSQFRYQHQNEVKFDPPHIKIKLISTPPLKSRPHSKIKSISMRRHKNDDNFDPYTKTRYFRLRHKTKSIPIQALKLSKVQPPTLKSSIFRPPIPIKNLAYKNEANCDPSTKNKSISIPTLKPSQF